jgi:hypothetical protein
MSLATVTVDTTAGGVTIQTANANRKALFVKSLATNTQTVFLKFDASATPLTAANGYPLGPGEEIVFTRETSVPGDPAVYEVKGITSAASADIRTQEL